MRHSYFTRLFVVIASVFLLSISNVSAQIGELGIYGSVPEGSRDSIRYVYLQTVMAYDGSPDHFLPVNGLGNFNFYYEPSGQGFIPADTYRVWYFAANKTTNYGYDTVSYSPNGGHTNGEEVRPFNDPPGTPRGVHGIIYGRIGGVDYPIPNAQILALPSFQFGQFGVQSRSNGDGFFSLYYKNGYGALFLPVYFQTSPPAEYYNLSIQGSVNNCFFIRSYQYDALWQPYVPDDPDSEHYFVTDAEFDWGNLILTPYSCT